MAKKLTQYEIDCIARQLDKSIIVPLTEENDKIIAQFPDNPEMLKDIQKLKELEEKLKVLEIEKDKLEEQQEKILIPYSGAHYAGRRDPQAWVEGKHLAYKKDNSILKPVPSYTDIRDLIILNSNLELQDIIKVITDQFM